VTLKGGHHFNFLTPAFTYLRPETFKYHHVVAELELMEETFAEYKNFVRSDVGRQWHSSLLAQEDWRKFCITCIGVGGFFHLLRGIKSGEIHIKFSQNSDTLSLGTISQLNSRTTCIGCQSILNAVASLSHNIAPSDTVQVWLSADKITVQRISEQGRKYEPFFTQRISGEWSMAYDNEERGRLFDPYSVDLDLLRRWLKRCAISHGTECNAIAPKDMSTITSLLLVDVDTKCLVTTPLETRYVALSYVWGAAEMLVTTYSNIEVLREAGSLSGFLPNIRLPITIRDAMNLTRTLGERYLWVDCLCIVQDDPSKQDSLKSMAFIYANAQFTIVAADAVDANYGIRGTRGASEPRNIPCNVINIPGERCLMYKGQNSMASDSLWASRGWTFQEALFSRRLLIFNGLVTYHCNSALAWTEMVEVKSEVQEAHGIQGTRMDVQHGLGDARLIGLMNHLPRWPDLNFWGGKVDQFSVRNLTYDSDAVDALLGATEVLSRTYQGGFFYGIPELFFDIGLLWHPILPEESAQRRAAIGIDGRNSLPSWSWIGWKGKMCQYAWLKFFQNGFTVWTPEGQEQPSVDDHHPIELEPILHWYKKSISPNTDKLTKIDNSIFKFRSLRNNAAQPMPPGWTRSIGEGGRMYYSHKLIENRTFSYPLPISDQPYNTQSEAYEPYLYLTASRTFLKIGATLRDDNVLHTTLVALLDSQNQLVGSVRLHTERNAYQKGAENCELIAISRGTIEDSQLTRKLLNLKNSEEWEFWKWDAETKKNNEAIYEFYNVLWIKWLDGIAYRQGIGRVARSAWERQNLQQIDIKLG
jgi:hypothetical protein